MAYLNVLVPALRAGVRKVVLYSSMAVYGDQTPPFSEEMPRRPVDVYGVNKAGMEEITEILADVHDFSYTIIRPHNVFGERQSLRDPFRNVVAIFMNRILRGEPLYIFGDGEQRRAFSYLGDALPALLPRVRSRPVPRSPDSKRRQPRGHLHQRTRAAGQRRVRREPRGVARGLPSA